MAAGQDDGGDVGRMEAGFGVNVHHFYTQTFTKESNGYTVTQVSFSC